MKEKIQNCLVLTIIILCFFATADAQWSAVAPVYGGAIANDGAVSFSIGNTGYVAAGSSTGEMYRYDTSANVWTLVGNVPAAMGHSFAMSFVINGKAYIIGGDTSGVPQNSVWEFDPSAAGNPWTRKGNFPGGPRDAGFGFAINNSGYIGAGFDGSSLYSDIWKYNPVGDTWLQLPVYLPANGLLFPTSFVIAGKGYIVTGGTAPSGVNELTNMWCLDASNDSLSAKANFPGPGRSSAFAFSNSYYGYVGGGQSNFATNYYDMWMYDPSNDQWSPESTVPLYGAAWSSAFVIGNTAYAGIGAKFVGTSLSGTDAFFRFFMSNMLTGITNTGTENNQVMVYPDPAGDNLYLAGAWIPSAEITITDLMGRIVKRAQTIPENNSLFIGDLSPGIYNMLVTDNHRTRTRRFVKD